MAGGEWQSVKPKISSVKSKFESVVMPGPGGRGILKRRIANRKGGSSRNVLRTGAVVTSAMLAWSEFGGPARAVTLYWDTDGSTGGNNASTGANLGGSGIWSTADA